MERLSPTKTLAYSAGNFAAGMYYAFNNFALPLYLSLFTSNALVIGWLSSTRSFEQSISQPLVGSLSDNVWTRLGRRAPFFLIAMPLSALLLFYNGLLPHDPSLVLVVVMTIFVFSYLFNLGIDPYTALLADVIPSEQRGTVNGIKEVIGFLGQVAILIAGFVVLASHPEWLFDAVAAGMVIGFTIVALGVRERRDRMSANPNAVRGGLLRLILVSVVFLGVAFLFALVLLGLLGIVGIILIGLIVLVIVPFVFPGLLSYLRNLYREQREAVKLLGVKFLYQIGVNAAAPFLTLFVVSEIGLKGWPEMVAVLPASLSAFLGQRSADEVALFLAAFLLLMTGVFAAPAGLLGDRFGKKRVFAVGLIVMGISGILAAFATAIPQLMFYLIFLGFGISAQTVLFFPYLTDLVPGGRVGEFQGLSATAETAGVAISILLAGGLINMNLFGLKYRLIFIITGIFLLLGFLAVLFVKAKLTPSISPVTPEPTIEAAG